MRGGRMFIGALTALLFRIDIPALHILMDPVNIH
jgi:hypothetical protein